MKKFYSWMVLMTVALSLGLTSCSDGDDEPTVEPVAPELLTFGFYAADNAEVLSADYEGVVSATDKTVKVTMPAFADKSSLVAKFTVGEGNTVTVNGVTQQSGVTANDFSVPVDYIVSNAEGTMNAKYTVTVENASNYAWSEVGRFNAVVPRGDNAIMRLNPVDNTPYVAFVTKSTPNKVAVIKYDNGTFANVGSAEGESGKVTSGRYSFAISNTGTPYYIYSDESITDPVKSAPTVMSFNGSAWTTVGQAGIAGFVPSKVQIGVIGNEVIAPMVVNANNGSYVKREMYASIYNGNWSTNSLSTVGMASGVVESLTTTDNAAYLYSISAGDYKYSVAEYKNGTWTSLRSNYLEDGATQAPAVMADAASIAATNDGTVFVLTADDAETHNTKDMRFRILKYSPDTKEWTLLGGTTMTSIKADDSHISAKIAVAPNGTPFFAYCDYKGDKLAKVQYFDNETKQWSAPEAVSAEPAESISIAFCDNGEAYICYVGNDSNIVLLKYAAKN